MKPTDKHECHKLHEDAEDPIKKPLIKKPHYLTKMILLLITISSTWMLDRCLLPEAYRERDDPVADN